MKKSVLILTVIASVLLASCGKPEAKVNEKKEEAVFAVNTFVTSKGNLDEYLEFGGDISSVSAVDVMPDMAGKISRILVNVGDHVEKDQVLAYVDASRPGMNYSASPVKSPVSGTVVSFTPTIGSMVSQAYSISKISNTSELQIKVNVAERFVSRIKNGQNATVTLDAYPGEVFEAKVFEVSPVLDTTSRTMGIKLKFINQNEQLKAGMYGRIRLVTESFRNVIIVPSNAVITRENKPYVFVAQKNDDVTTVKLVEVKLGITVDNKTEIQEGLNVGDEVIVKGQSLLNDGSVVNVISVTK